jgi:hypothetical protein
MAIKVCDTTAGYPAPMKLYVCYGTFPGPKLPGRPNGHVCRYAHEELVKAGHKPEVIKAYGFGPLPDWINRSEGRREAQRLTGTNWVPLMVTDSGEFVQGSQEIADWAAANPA